MDNMRQRSRQGRAGMGQHKTPAVFSHSAVNGSKYRAFPNGDKRDSTLTGESFVCEVPGGILGAPWRQSQ